MLSTYLCYVYMGAHSALICHVLAIYCIAGKFDGELNLAVWQLGLNLPMRNDATHNDIMHSVATTLGPVQALRKKCNQQYL